MTEVPDGDSSSPASEETGEPPPAHPKPCPSLFARAPVAAAPLLGAPFPGANEVPLAGTLTLPADLPLDPGLLLAVGITLAFLGGLIENALQKFSPALLVMRLEKRNGVGEEAQQRNKQLEKELQESEAFIPSIVMLKFAGLGVALLGALALLDGTTLWPAGWPGIAILFVLAILFVGILPNRITDFRAESIVFRMLPLLRVLRVLFLPITVPVSKLSSFVVRNLLGIREEVEQESDREKLADEIRAAVEDSDETEELADEEKEWIENIVEFRKEDAAGIMTPRTDMVGIEASTKLIDALKVAVDAGHSRLPVFEKKMDNIVGIFYLRDAVGALTQDKAMQLDKPVSQHLRQAFFVPESKKVSDLLHEFKARRVQVAIVVDEYGGTAGLVSIEDILEEIVGPIEDEYDPERENPLRVDEDGHRAEVDAKVRIGELNEAMSIEVPESDDYETIGGFVFSHLGRIPQAGESFQYENLDIHVMSADARRIGRLQIRVRERNGRTTVIRQ